MAYLRGRVADLAALIPRNAPVVYLDYPVHTNIGDLLIERGTEGFFEELKYEVVEQRSVYDFCASARRRVPAGATIVLHGGGNFGDLYELHQAFREDVIASFPNHRIVMLPQTLHFESVERLRSAATIFARHADLHVCLRDTVSLETYRRHFGNPAYLAPDMAHFLWRAPGYRATDESHRGTLMLVRRDREHQEIGDRAAARQQACDWSDLIRPLDKLTFRTLQALHARHCAIGDTLPVARLWRRFVRRLIENTRRAVAPHDAIVTNRLHAALFGLLLGKPVTMWDNSYGKLSSYYATWLSTIPDVRLAGGQSAESWSDRRKAMAGGGE